MGLHPLLQRQGCSCCCVGGAGLREAERGVGEGREAGALAGDLDLALDLDLGLDLQGGDGAGLERGVGAAAHGGGQRGVGRVEPTRRVAVAAVAEEGAVRNHR